MKNKDNSETKQKSQKVNTAVSDKDLNMVSGGCYRPGQGNYGIDNYIDIAYCNHCDGALGEIWEGVDCPIKYNIICPHCHQPIRLNQCRIETIIIKAPRLL